MHSQRNYLPITKRTSHNISNYALWNNLNLEFSEIAMTDCPGISPEVGSNTFNVVRLSHLLMKYLTIGKSDHRSCQLYLNRRHFYHQLRREVVQIPSSFNLYGSSWTYKTKTAILNLKYAYNINKYFVWAISGTNFSRNNIYFITGLCHILHRVLFHHPSHLKVPMHSTCAM